MGSGKVREIFAIDDETLLIVTTDRISAYDVVLPDLVPDKGKVLTGLSVHWFELLDTANHLLSIDVADMPDVPGWDRESLAGRAMLVRRAEVVPMECVVRGYLYGSAWREYTAGGGPSTADLPTGMVLADRLPHPIFTPSTKAEEGHDENLTEPEARRLVGDELYEDLRRRSIELYLTGAAYAEERAIILADTKFEFGVSKGDLILIDEVLTPDSSRYWPAEGWRPGAPVPSYDKQFVRDALDTQGWDHQPPAPPLSDETVALTAELYRSCFELLTGRAFVDYVVAARSS